MSCLHIVRAVVRAHPSTALRFPLPRRGYADAVTDKIKLTLALPHQVRRLSESSQIAQCLGVLMPLPYDHTNV